MWGLGIGDWGLGPIPNPQSPIPNPQILIVKTIVNYYLILKILFINNYLLTVLLKYNLIKKIK